MPTRTAPKRKLGSAFAWAINGLAIILLLAVVLTYFARQPVQASSAPFVYLGRTPRPTGTPAPTSFFLPTITPNPLATPIEDFSTPTPFIFSGGLAPGVAGYSILGEPIQYYSFGAGERRFLIVAGIHGAYGGNTTALSHHLIVY